MILFAANAFGIFYISQYLTTVPSDLIDAGRIDGRSEFGMIQKDHPAAVETSPGRAYLLLCHDQLELVPLAFGCYEGGSLFPLNVGASPRL